MDAFPEQRDGNGFSRREPVAPRMMRGDVHRQVCTDLPCALRGADEFMEELCSNLGIKVGETTPDGLITVEAVTCLAGCDKAPMFQLQSAEGIEYHEDMTVDRTLELIQILKRAGREVA